MSVDHIETNVGLVRVPDQHREGAHTEQHLIVRNGELVDIYFTASRATADPFGEWDDNEVGEVVAHVSMARAHFEKLPGTLAVMIQHWGWTAVDPD